MGNNSIDDETEAILNRSFTRKKRTASSMPSSGRLDETILFLVNHSLALRCPFGQHFHVFIGHFHQLQYIVIIAAILRDVRYGLERL